MNHFKYCLLFVAFTVFLLPAGAQTEFSTPAGDLIHCGSDTEIEIENPLSQNKKITLTPQDNSRYAHLRITNKEGVTHYFAKTKIFFDFETEELLMESEARVKKGEDYIYGPEKIHYLPQNNKVLIVGTKTNPACFLFTETQQKQKWYNESKEIELTVKTQNGNREITNFKTFQNSTLTNYPSLESIPSKLMRKLSPPVQPD